MKKENFKTNFSPLNNSKLKNIKGGATSPCLSICDANIVTTCCYNVTPPVVVKRMG